MDRLSMCCWGGREGEGEKEVEMERGNNGKSDTKKKMERIRNKKELLFLTHLAN